MASGGQLAKSYMERFRTYRVVRDACPFELTSCLASDPWPIFEWSDLEEATEAILITFQMPQELWAIVNTTHD